MLEASFWLSEAQYNSGYSQDTEGVVTCSDETRHNLTDEDYVTFREVEGMVELNGCEPKRVKTLG